MIRIKRREDMILSSETKKYFDPARIYIPVELNNKVLVKKDEHVYINQLITDSYYSSISGIVIDIISLNSLRYVIIENDYEENKFKFESKPNIVEIMQQQYKFSQDQYDNLVIDIIDNEPYIKNYEYMLKNELIKLIDTIDTIYDNLNFKKVILLIRDSYTEVLDKLYSIINSYPNIEIKLHNEAYPKKIKIKKNDYKISIADVYNIKCLVDEQMYPDKCYISVAGNAINHSSVIETKKYVMAEDIIIDNFKIIDSNYSILINGLMNGTITDNLNFIIDEKISSIFIMKKENAEENQCINCGECVKNCPMNLNPKYIFENPRTKRSQRLSQKCLHCNVCSYVCPAKRNLSRVEDCNE